MINRLIKSAAMILAVDVGLITASMAAGDNKTIVSASSTNTPEKIYVVTDEGTFSAAFHYAFYLSKLGAIIAGETSSQAPNSYMEVTPFTLPLTGVSGSISNSMQVFLPGKDPRSKEFTPEVSLTYEDYHTYGFDNNSIMIYLLESLK